MGNKCLITYTSFTGNTEKVALRFKETFENQGWQCDVFKVRKQAGDILRPPYDIRRYDFLCAGSGLRAHLPYNEDLEYAKRVQNGNGPQNNIAE